MSIADQSFTCRQVVEQATEWFEGALGEARTAQIEAHLASCVHCREMIVQLQMTIRLAGTAQHEPLSPEQKTQLLALPRYPEQPPKSITAEISADTCVIKDNETARAYIEDRLPDDQQVAVLEHLIDGCEVCASMCRRLAFPRLSRMEPAMRRLRERLPDRELDETFMNLFENVDQADWAARLENVGHEPRVFLLWMIRFARGHLFDDTSRCEQFSDAAVHFSRAMDPEDRARAAMLRGQVARKVKADFREADHWFGLASRLLDSVPSSDLLRAKLLRMRGLARYCQSRHSEANAFLMCAAELYLSHNEVARFGECQLDLASVASESSSPEKALRIVLSATTVIQWAGYPRHPLAVAQNLALYSADLSRSRRALKYLGLARAHLLLSGGAVDVVHLDWTEGRILGSAGEHSDAANILDRARLRFIEMGLPSKAAWVALDLSLSLIALGRVEDLQSVSAAMLGYFASRTLPREALTALVLYRDALASRSVGMVHVQSLIACLASHEGVTR